MCFRMFCFEFGFKWTSGGESRRSKDGGKDNLEQQADILYLAQEKYFTLMSIKASLQLVLKNILLPELFFQ